MEWLVAIHILSGLHPPLDFANTLLPYLASTIFALDTKTQPFRSISQHNKISRLCRVQVQRACSASRTPDQLSICASKYWLLSITPRGLQYRTRRYRRFCERPAAIAASSYQPHRLSTSKCRPRGSSLPQSHTRQLPQPLRPYFLSAS